MITLVHGVVLDVRCVEAVRWRRCLMTNDIRTLRRFTRSEVGHLNREGGPTGNEVYNLPLLIDAVRQ